VSAFLAPSLSGLRAEVNGRWPHRDRTSDGWLGDAAHAARESDHNPDARGMVHAIDLDKDGLDVAAVLRAVIGDPRVWYVIHNRTIWSRTYGWKANPYTGTNPHTGHVHVSIRYDATSENDTRSWFGPTPRTKGLPSVDASNLIGQAKRSAEGHEDLKDLPGARLVQRALNDRLDLQRAHRLTVDGKLGPRSRHAIGVMQDRFRSHGHEGVGRGGIPTLTFLRLLGRGRFGVHK
jgi:hypothetical protein